ncbi:MAG: aminotransferase [Phycisphaerales bacterium]|nr:MAG: aminotransferase [Phycisphaerales bacterium]
MIVYLNGQFLPAEDAHVSVFDRGFLFGDGVYEGLRVFEHTVMCPDRHVRRMAQGLAESRIEWDAQGLPALCLELCRRNGLADAFMYVQVTRGAPPAGQPVRSRTMPHPGEPTVLAFATAQPPMSAYDRPPTTHLALVPDRRWSRGHLKSISLLGNVLAAYEAQERGAQEVAMHRDGLVTEACASNIIVSIDGQLATPSLESVSILEGVTRARCLELEPGIVERPVRVEELLAADEVILVGTTSIVTSALTIDGRPVGQGTPGPWAHRLLERVMADCRAQVRHARQAVAAG